MDGRMKDLPVGWVTLKASYLSKLIGRTTVRLAIGYGQAASGCGRRSAASPSRPALPQWHVPRNSRSFHGSCDVAPDASERADSSAGAGGSTRTGGVLTVEPVAGGSPDRREMLVFDCKRGDESVLRSPTHIRRDRRRTAGRAAAALVGDRRRARPRAATSRTATRGHLAAGHARGQLVGEVATNEGEQHQEDQVRVHLLLLQGRRASGEPTDWSGRVSEMNRLSFLLSFFECMQIAAVYFFLLQTQANNQPYWGGGGR